MRKLLLLLVQLRLTIIDELGRTKENTTFLTVPYLTNKMVRDTAGEIIANWDPHTHPIITEVEGKIEFLDFIEGVHYYKQTDELTGLSSIVIIDPAQRPSAGKEMRPMAELVDAKGNDLLFLVRNSLRICITSKAIVKLEDGAKYELVMRLLVYLKKVRKLVISRVVYLALPIYLKRVHLKMPAILAEVSVH